jgi:aldehyde:ferredoxin oxidoreductase
VPGGYAGKFLEVDLTRRKIKDTRLNDATLEMFFGGRGARAIRRT